MTDYSWFKLLVKGIGILLIGLGLPWLFSIVSMLGWLSDPAYANAGISWWIMYCISSLGGLFQLLFGLYLVVDGRRLIDRCLRGVFGHCPACGYDVRSIASPACPECGIALPGRSPTALQSRLDNLHAPAGAAPGDPPTP